MYAEVEQPFSGHHPCVYRFWDKLIVCYILFNQPCIHLAIAWNWMLLMVPKLFCDVLDAGADLMRSAIEARFLLR